MKIAKKILGITAAATVTMFMCCTQLYSGMQPLNVEAEEAEATMLGDVNFDGRLDVRDSAALLRYLSMKYGDNPDVEIPENADFDGDGKATVRDAVVIARQIVSGLLSGFGSYSGEGSYASISIGSATALPGSVVSVPVYIECNNNLESTAFLIEWDDALLVNGKPTAYGNQTCISELSDGKCAIALYHDGPFTDGQVVYIDFEVPSDASAGESYSINITDIETFAEFDGEDLADTGSVSAIGGSITIEGMEEPIENPIGDANNDGNMTVSDAAFIARTLAKREVIDVKENPYADYNGDGKVTVADAAAIARELAKAKR
ncbi:MAG: hypothetical protein E7508_06270 [Ruminococcus sp.]|nr:hypothetical protein [Ruminococcus sp.]